jgi:hypothetical protein
LLTSGFAVNLGKVTVVLSTLLTFGILLLAFGERWPCSQFVELPFQQTEDCSSSAYVQSWIKQAAVKNDILLANKPIQLIRVCVFALGEFHTRSFVCIDRVSWGKVPARVPGTEADRLLIGMREEAPISSAAAG